MDVDLDLAQVTLSRVDRVCHVQDAHLDDVLALREDVRYYTGTGEALLDIIAPRHGLDPLVAERVAQDAAQVWMRMMYTQIVTASLRGKHYADRCGVWELMESQGGDASLARVLSRFDPDAYQMLWHEMEVHESMTYLLMRAVDELTENLEDYI